MLDSSNVQAVPEKVEPTATADKVEAKPLINISSLAKRLRAEPTLVEVPSRY